MKRVTIYDIAKVVNVSPATVSRAINGKGSMSDHLRQEILKVAESLKYIPDPAARSLKTQKTNQIMLSIPSVQDIFFNDLIKEVQDLAFDYDYSLLVHSTEYDANVEMRILSGSTKQFIDGLIFVSLNVSEEHLVAVASSSLPTVLCSTGNIYLKNTEQHCDYIAVDSYKAACSAMKHLIDQGHRDIGFVNFLPDTMTAKERYEAFQDALKQNHLPFTKDYVFEGTPDQSFGYAVGEKICSYHKRPSAIFCTADMITLGLIRSFKEKEIRIPQDIAIVSIDNINIASYTSPNISSVGLRQDEMGRKAAKMIFDRIHGSKRPFSSTVLQPEFYVRESSVFQKK